jgi:hypothetical protein
MIELRDSIYIEAPPRTVWAWFERLPEHFPRWHPDHVSCNWVRGSAIASGTEMEVVEVLHGIPHQLRIKLTDVVPGLRVAYRIYPGVGGYLEIEPYGAGTRFTASIRLGTRFPVFGTVLDWVQWWWFGARINAFATHQREEGINLKLMLDGQGKNGWNGIERRGAPPLEKTVELNK